MGFGTINVIQKAREMGGRECQWVLREVEAPRSHPPHQVMKFVVVVVGAQLCAAQIFHEELRKKKNETEI